MRVEWELDGFNIPKDKIAEYFDTLVGVKHHLVSERGEWQVDIAMVISNHTKLKSITEKYDIPYHHLPITPDNKADQEGIQTQLIHSHGVNLIVLARYMQILSDGFVKEFQNKIINIHHSSLPAFIGANPYKAAYQRGVKFMGATGHYVTADLDEGPIIAQDIIPISHRDSIADLKRKGRDIEKIVLAKAVWSHINHKIIVHQNKTVVFE